VFARLLSKLLRDDGVGKRVVPIIPDEARTFGMDALFSQVGIYSSVGQLYEPVDKGKVLYYRESKDGQVLEEGINEAGSLASFIAAGTAYSNHSQPMIPFYIFYSMFGFQRVGDLIWAAGDAMARGFLLGATAGRTTLQGEGLQHDDGHSLVLAETLPACVAYDPAFAYELATIVEDGLDRMYNKNESVIYYIALYNENYLMPGMPEGSRDGILKGIYRFSTAEKQLKHHVQLLGSGPMINEALRARELLKAYDVSADIWSVTSYTELRNDAIKCERYNRMHPDQTERVPYIAQALSGVKGPFITVSDFMKLLADFVARWVPGQFVPLGTEGFGLSDTRQSLRRHFEIDAENVAYAALDALRREGGLDVSVQLKARTELGLDADKIDPLDV